MVLEVFLTILFSLCSTAILSYISMAVAIGPWIESTIVLFATLCFGLFARSMAQQTRNQSIALVTAGASIGGILATGCGFAFPTLYFLNPDLFNAWLAQPWYFAGIMTSICLIAGSLGMLLANIFEHRLLVAEQMPFPIGELSYKMIAAQNSTRKAVELGLGFALSTGYSIVQKVMSFPNTLSLIAPQAYGVFKIPPFGIPMMEFPMLWAIGFVTGHVIAIPLAVGIVTKVLITTPAHAYYFTHLKENDFLMAFTAGMVLYGAFMSIIDLPKLIMNVIQKIKKREAQAASPTHTSGLSDMQWPLWIITLLLTSGIFFYFKFNVLYQLYLVGFTVLCVYQLLILGGKQGLAPMPRFATFVMLPAMVIFGIDALQLTILSTYVEVCGGVAVDIMFGRKMAHLSELPHKKIQAFQWLGMIVSSLAVGVVFWLLITKLGLGSERLLAQRASTRALTINFQHFDFFALILGALFGSILKEFKISPIMVLGGLLMRLEWSVILVLSGLSTYLVKDKEQQYPFWSGIFAANSLWMILQSFLF